MTPFDIGGYAEAIERFGSYHVATVGAASGIGAEAARFLGGLGLTVSCLDRDPAGAEDTAKGIREQGGTAVAFALDVTEASSVRKGFEAARAERGPIHALLNCAGVTGITNVATHAVDLADFDRVTAINLRGTLITSQAVLPEMLEQGYGRILHVASIAGKEGNARMAAYSATKAGVIGLVKVMGKEYATAGVTINALAPAVIRTPLVEALPEETVAYMTDKIPMKRCGELGEATRLIAYALSPACSFTTGFAFDLSGGRATY